jgi:ketosteroid isomerase-like protein
MPTESAELRAIADSVFRALNAGDLDGFLALIAEDVEFTSMLLEMEGVTFRGHDGVRTWWSTVHGTFDGIWWELLGVEGSATRGVAKVRAAGTVGGAKVEQMVWGAATLRDGKVGWWAFYRTERDARSAAGLPC